MTARPNTSRVRFGRRNALSCVRLARRCSWLAVSFLTVTNLCGCGLDFDAAFAESGWRAPDAEGGLAEDSSFDRMEAAQDATSDLSVVDSPVDHLDSPLAEDSHVEAESSVVQEGSTPSCDNGVQDGTETGIDCGGTCAACLESCTNGSDDDGDTLVDCQDPECDAFACSPGAPAEWTGPVVLYVGKDPPPACGGQEVASGGVGTPQAPSAQCSACACAKPTGISCPPPSIELFDPMHCSGGAGDMTVVPHADGTCTTFQDPVQYDSARIMPAPPQGGSCLPSGGEPSGGVASWGTYARACLLAPTAAAGCGAGAVCAPLPASPFLPTLCVARPGEFPCPASEQARTVVYTTLVDERSCTPCLCSPPTGASCQSGVVSIYGSSNCSTEPVARPNAAACVELTIAGTFTSASYDDTADPGGVCTPSGGTPAGSVQASSPVTVCCSK